jgi:hypothetical protein
LSLSGGGVDGHVDAEGPELAEVGADLAVAACLLVVPAGAEVGAWLRGNTDLRLNEARWSVQTYERYLATMFLWADEMAVAADELEACIFSEQSEVVGSQWTHTSRARSKTAG